MGSLSHCQSFIQDILQGDTTVLRESKHGRLTCRGQLNSIGLSKNILRALQASRTDMPSLDAFPKSHVVTFKYYVGVIHFLEEDYVQVILRAAGYLNYHFIYY